MKQSFGRFFEPMTHALENKLKLLIGIRHWSDDQIVRLVLARTEHRRVEMNLARTARLLGEKGIIEEAQDIQFPEGYPRTGDKCEAQWSKAASSMSQYA